MVNVHVMARLGVLAMGLGIGAAWAQTPVASADSSGDWLSTIDSLLSGDSPASATPINLFISFDGHTIFASGDASGNTFAGDYGLAIAYGDGAHAEADGAGGLAVADGSGADAFSNGGTGDVAEAIGTNASANAGAAGPGLVGANYDTAIDIGNNSIAPNVGGEQGAYAGYSNLNGGLDGGTGVHDTAIDIGNNTNETVGVDDNEGAFAGAGGLQGPEASGDGNNDTAIDVGNNSGEFNGSFSLDGNGNYASDSGGYNAEDNYTYAGQGNDNTAIADTANTAANAGIGNHDYAFVDGPAGSTAAAEFGNSNIAYVVDPFGAVGSPDTAFAGDGSFDGSFSHDLAEVLFAHGTAYADTAPLLYDIVSLFGNFSGSF